MTRVTVHFAKTNLSKLIAKVEAGEEVVICRGNTPVVKLLPAAPRKRGAAAGDTGVREHAATFEAATAGVWDGRSPRKPGALKGVIKLDESFFDELDDESLGLADDERDGA